MSLIQENDTKPPTATTGEEEQKSFLANASFPKKLFDLINTTDSDIVRWEEHGKAFRIVDAEIFAEQVLPKYFRHSKLTSFQRQLNLYGFRRITKGEDQGSYYHAKFQRGKPSSVSEIRRLQGKAAPNLSHGSGAAYGKKDIQIVDKSAPMVQMVQNLPDSDSGTLQTTQLDCSVPMNDTFDMLPLSSPAAQLQIPSGFGDNDDTLNFSHNVSDFGWCSSNSAEGFEDSDPLDLNFLDGLFDADPSSLMA